MAERMAAAQAAGIAERAMQELDRSIISLETELTKALEERALQHAQHGATEKYFAGIREKTEALKARLDAQEPDVSVNDDAPHDPPKIWRPGGP